MSDQVDSLMAAIEDLREKQERGVKQVRVKTVLGVLEEASAVVAALAETASGYVDPDDPEAEHAHDAAVSRAEERADVAKKLREEIDALNDRVQVAEREAADAKDREAALEGRAEKLTARAAEAEAREASLRADTRMASALEASKGDARSLARRAEAAESREAELRRRLEAAEAIGGNGVMRLDGLLVGTREASEILGVEKQRLGRWQKSGHMPAPIAKVAATPLWLRADIEALRGRVDARKRDATLVD